MILDAFSKSTNIIRDGVVRLKFNRRDQITRIYDFNICDFYNKNYVVSKINSEFGQGVDLEKQIATLFKQASWQSGESKGLITDELLSIVKKVRAEKNEPVTLAHLCIAHVSAQLAKEKIGYFSVLDAEEVKYTTPIDSSNTDDESDGCYYGMDNEVNNEVDNRKKPNPISNLTWHYFGAKTDLD